MKGQWTGKLCLPILGQKIQHQLSKICMYCQRKFDIKLFVRDIGFRQGDIV